jgi:hypothetical protein
MKLDAIVPGRVNASLTISEHNRMSIQYLNQHIDALASSQSRQGLLVYLRIVNFILLTLRRIPDVTSRLPRIYPFDIYPIPHYAPVIY